MSPGGSPGRGAAAQSPQWPELCSDPGSGALALSLVPPTRAVACWPRPEGPWDPADATGPRLPTPHLPRVHRVWGSPESSLPVSGTHGNVDTEGPGGGGAPPTASAQGWRWVVLSPPGPGRPAPSSFTPSRGLRLARSARLWVAGWSGGGVPGTGHSLGSSPRPGCYEWPLWGAVPHQR